MFLVRMRNSRSRFKHLPPFHSDALSYVKQLNENAFIESVPEVHVVPVSVLYLSTLRILFMHLERRISHDFTSPMTTTTMTRQDHLFIYAPKVRL